MKLYATTTSERASKGQGGNELKILLSGNTGEKIIELTLTDEGQGYGLALSGQFLPIMHNYTDKPFLFLFKKGKSQKGENEKCYSCNKIPDIYGRCKCCNKDAWS